MIQAALAASTANALIQGLQGKRSTSHQDAASQAAQQFGSQLNALLPGAGSVGAALGNVTALGQDLLSSLGLGGNAAAATSGISAAGAARAYAATGSSSGGRQ